MRHFKYLTIKTFRFPYLFQASLDAAVFARDYCAVPVVCSSTGHAQIWVALPHSQVAGTLFRVTLSLTPAAWEAVLAWKTLDTQLL